MLNQNKFYYISDFFASDLLGGGELNDHELLLLLQARDYVVYKKRSHEVTITDIMVNKNDNFVISNFVNLKKEVIHLLIDQCNYIIYEHDHKYLRSRNPAIYDNLLAPKDQIVFFDFYKNAKGVICQSSFHKEIMHNNLLIDNIISISGNLWSSENLNLIAQYSEKQKHDKASVMNSRISHKNTADAIKYCRFKKIEYDLISSNDYKIFLNLLSDNNKFIFFPKTPETLSRVVVEAKMMGMKVITNKLVGAANEDWFVLKGKELVDVMKERRNTIPDTVIGLFK